ncbi:hypothetical protein BT96DRAFT_625710 [Gymnopus androsaceus JB14]|uniref:Uncharacterized protein n=1 Tax=Gymnopus androsaceus JB14 TaxID=1447944 RepID=A0A6A4IIP9_9AGAR|nr:hypothetical protein BT96DRAFT_625710 [Gymnopus androsaceus JB14]
MQRILAVTLQLRHVSGQMGFEACLVPSRVVTTVTLLLSNHHDVVLCEMLYVVEWLTILKAEADGLKIYSKRCLCFDFFFIINRSIEVKKNAYQQSCYIVIRQSRIWRNSLLVCQVRTWT